jgi:hypothetical protein
MGSTLAFRRSVLKALLAAAALVRLAVAQVVGCCDPASRVVLARSGWEWLRACATCVGHYLDHRECSSRSHAVSYWVLASCAYKTAGLMLSRTGARIDVKRTLLSWSSGKDSASRAFPFYGSNMSTKLSGC